MRSVGSRHVFQCFDIFGETAAAVAQTGVEELGSDAGIIPHAGGDLVLSEIGRMLPRLIRSRRSLSRSVSKIERCSGSLMEALKYRLFRALMTSA